MAKIEQDNYVTTNRANYRAIFDFGGPSWWIVDGGVSENLLSCIYIIIKPITMISGKSSFPKGCFQWSPRQRPRSSCDIKNNHISI